jgi:hypothetical protein
MHYFCDPNLKPMKKSLIVLLTLGALYLSACKDETTEDPTPTLSRSELLIAGNWQMTSGTIVPPIKIDLFGQVITISDFMEFMDSEPCEKDDLIIFNTNGTITNDEGATKCDPADPQTTAGGNWALVESDAKLRMIEDGDTTMITIQELTAKTMKGSTLFLNEGDTSTTTHTINFTFENKK